MFGLFHDSWNAFPTFALLDHTMTIRAKPWTLNSNTNSNSCDGTNQTIDGWSGGSTSDFIQQLLDECGQLCEPCSDTVDSDGDGVGDECDDCHNLSGDVNDDYTFDILDIVTTVNIILAGGAGSGDFTECEEADADMDSNGLVNILDVIQIINLILDSRAIHSSGDVKVTFSDSNEDLKIYFSSEVNFSGVQIDIAGEFPYIDIQAVNDISFRTNIVNGMTHIVAFSSINEPFEGNKVSFEISDGSVIDIDDIDIIASSPSGKALNILDGGTVLNHPGSPNGGLPGPQFKISSAYPNPFNPTTTLSFSVPENGNINFSAFDIRGNEVDRLQLNGLHKGENTFTWDANEFPSGLYYLKLDSQSESIFTKVLLMK